MKDFGAIIKLNDEQSALLSKDNFYKRNINIGDKIDCVVIQLDSEKRKVFVSYSDDTNPVLPETFFKKR